MSAQTTPSRPLLILLSLILAGCTFGQTAAQPSPPAAQMGLTAAPAATATPLPTPGAPPTPASAAAAESPEAAGNLASYSGSVVAEDRIDVLAEVSGRVQGLYVEVDSSVQAGDILLEQEKTTLEARRAQAMAVLEAAEAQLDLLRAEPEASDLAAAQAGVAAAVAAYQRAVDGPTAEELRMAEAQLRQAEAAVAQAQSAYDLVKWNANIAAMPQSLQLQQATLQLEAARAQYDKLVKGATADVIAGTAAQISQARARLDALERGPREAQIRAAEAQVHQAEAALYLATLELDKATVRAPMDGVVVAVYTEVGSQAVPGTRVFTLQSHAVKVEVAVAETALASLAVGRPVEIAVNAYPGRVFPGTIAIIAPALDPATRTVQVTVRPTGDSAGLRPGMFATVVFGVEGGGEQ